MSATLGNGVTQTFAGGSGYTGLDRFGRVKDLRFAHPNVTTPSDGTLFKYAYAYDPAGNP